MIWDICDSSNTRRSAVLFVKGIIIGFADKKRLCRQSAFLGYSFPSFVTDLIQIEILVSKFVSIANWNKMCLDDEKTVEDEPECLVMKG